ncbi:hypothetical protein ZWY2020_028007 [Hordeum vulgare]|nr:hypothetical protein ZWY2020_028007 [Hordeum vulgare]
MSFCLRKNPKHDTKEKEKTRRKKIGADGPSAPLKAVPPATQAHQMAKLVGGSKDGESQQMGEGEGDTVDGLEALPRGPEGIRHHHG